MNTPPVSLVPEDGSIFLEPAELDGCLGLAIKIDWVLWRKRSKYQEICMVEAGRLGRVLLLDGSIQLSAFDEPAYHEMLVHVPLLSHPDPRRVLIIGGGDGCSLREALKHPSVERVDLCEIDGEVIEVCKRFLPHAAPAYADPRVRVHLGDGMEFAARAERAYDVILVDAPDPEGPALALFGRDFYQNLKKALKPGGLAAAQAESFNFYAPLLQEMFGFLENMFPSVFYYLALTPTYLGGTIGFAYSSLGPTPADPVDPGRREALGRLAYYTPLLHTAAFALPAHYYDLLPRLTADRQRSLLG